MSLKCRVGIHVLLALAVLCSACAAPPAVTPSPSATGALPAGGFLVAPGDGWKYSIKGVDQGLVWRFPNFNDADWLSGPSPLGTGDGAATRLQIEDSLSTAYFRSAFAFNPGAFEGELSLYLSVDAGAVVYVNGAEALRVNLPSGEPKFETPASACTPAVLQETLSLDLFREGENTLAVEVHPCGGERPEFVFGLALGAAPEITRLVSSAAGPQASGSTPQTAAPQPTIAASPTPAFDEFYVSPQGSPQGDGSRANPWDLETALAQPEPVDPGDTIWMMGGVYGSGGATKFKCKLQGSEGLPVTLRALPGERVTVDGYIQVMKPWATIWGLEVTNSDPDRISEEGSSHPEDLSRMDGVDLYASHTALINNVIHDTRQGSGFWSDAPDSELYGNVIYNNGWSAPDRGHGHGVYTQNETGEKRIRENIIFSNFSGYNLHVYSTDGLLNGFRIEENILFNGVLLIGSENQPANDIVVAGNYLYNSQVELGYRAPGNGSLVFQDNTVHLVNKEPMEIKWWREVFFSRNQIWGNGVSLLSDGAPGTYRFSGNRYISSSTPRLELDGARKSWSQWQEQSGFDLDGSLSSAAPTGSLVKLLPNRYEPGRANIVVYNWDHLDSIPVDLSQAGLEPGDAFSLYNAQDYYGKSLTGVYDGNPVQVPMTGWNAALPVGWGELLSPNTFPEFGAFVVVAR